MCRDLKVAARELQFCKNTDLPNLFKPKKHNSDFYFELC